MKPIVRTAVCTVLFLVALGAAFAQQVTDGNRVGRFAAAIEFEDRLVHELMGGPVVIVRADHFHDVGDGVLGHQHPAEHTLLGG